MAVQCGRLREVRRLMLNLPWRRPRTSSERADSSGFAERLDREETVRAAAALGRVAVRTDPNDFVPARGVVGRLVETAALNHLSPEELKGLNEVVGADHAYLANVSWFDWKPTSPWWRVSLDGELPLSEGLEPDRWDELSPSLMWGEDGTWAVAFGEDHAVLAGSEAFVEAFGSRLPNSQKLDDLVDHLFSGRADQRTENAKLLAMVSRLYGVDESARIETYLGVSTAPTEDELERGVNALVPFADAWNLPLNPEHLYEMAFAVLWHARSSHEAAEAEEHVQRQITEFAERNAGLYSDQPDES